MTRRFPAVVCALSLFCAVFPLGAEPSKVTLWAHGGTDAEEKAAVTLVEHFNASQKTYRVEITHLRDDYFVSGSSFSYSSAVYAAALSGQLPDVLDLDGPNLANYAWRGFIRPLDDYLAASLKADILPSLVAQGTYNGHLYSVGQYDSGLALAGRRSQLIKAGIRIPRGVGDAWSFEEFKAALAKLKASGAAPYALDLKLNYGANEWFSYAFSPVLQGFGGDLVDRSSYRQAQGVLNGPESVAAVEFLKSLFDNKYSRLDSTDEDFINGTAALGFCGHWVALTYREALKDDFVLIPMPRWNRRAVTGMGSWCWAISKEAKNAEGAAAFLRFALQPEQILAFTNENGAIPGRTSVLASSKLFGEGGPYRIYAQQLQAGVAIPRPLTPAYPVITIAFYTALSDVLSKGTGVREALDKAALRIDKNIVDNGYYRISFSD